MAIAEELQKLFHDRGDSAYGGEAVTQLEHALQCAYLAEQEGAAASQVVAALLHDIGHLLHDLPEDAPEKGIDDRHENSGNAYLQQHFPTDVSEPVRLHVAAKRYLCAVDESYLGVLSEPSIVSLNLQGGPMSPNECSQFEALPFRRQAADLRRWDDKAKVADLPTPPIEHFLPLIAKLAK